MLLRRISVQNVRSFLDQQELLVDGAMSIIIGPNGGGKTNLLDAIVMMLRRHLFATRYLRHRPTPERPNHWDVEDNGNLYSMSLEKHSDAPDKPQIIEIEVEVSKSDIDNMYLIKTERADLASPVKRAYHVNPWAVVDGWALEEFQPGTRITYKLEDGRLIHDGSKAAKQFLEYLHLVETDNIVRSESKKAHLQLPMMYLPVNRTSSGFQSRVTLANIDDVELKRSFDAISSRVIGDIVQLAVGRIASHYCYLLHEDNVNAKEAFYKDEQISKITAELNRLGYEWELSTVDRNTNSYDIQLKKQGSSFLVSAASSGERELLTYLFAIYALNVRDAVIVVDEPELHLHPRWQKALFDLFERLSQETGNQFVVATHSPTFISPLSIEYVSRVYAVDQRSRILRLNSASLPNAKHLLNIVNSHNNEVIFFADKVVLVEGLSDRILFEKMISRKNSENDVGAALEFIDVGGKNLFSAYQKLLAACEVPTVTIADLDYVQQVGDDTIKGMFVTAAKKVKSEVIDEVASLDGAALVERIDEAMRTGNWTDADTTWQYIKSRRASLRVDLSESEKERLSEFLKNKRREGIFILSEGALEAYLPQGYRSKDTGKLIAFLEKEEFFEEMPDCKAELVEILDDITGGAAAS